MRVQHTYKPDAKNPTMKPVNQGIYGEINKKIKEATIIQKAAQREQHT